MEKAQKAIDDFDYAAYGVEPKDFYAGLKDMDWSQYEQASKMAYLWPDIFFLIEG